MRMIPLTKGKFALIDDEDFAWLSQWKWCYHSAGYAMRVDYDNGKKTILMHRVINNTPSDMFTDHIDGDRLNNSRANLRNATRQANGRNRIKRQIAASQYKGVVWHARSKKWQAGLSINKEYKYLGCYDREQDAAAAYNEAAFKCFGEYARLNEVA